MRGTGVWILVLLGAGLMIGYPITADSRIGGSPASRTGAPITNTFPESTCGSTSDCHVNSDGGPGQVVIEAPETYTPGTALAFKVRVEEQGRSVFGFQVAVKAFNAQEDLFEHVGTLELVDPTTTRFVTGNYVTHDVDGVGQNEWTVRWVPPAGDVGPVGIYAAGNAANGDGKKEGDHTYTTSWMMTSGTSTAVEEVPAAEHFALERAYPNPFTTSTTIRYHLNHAASVTFSVYDALGRRVRLRHLGMQSVGEHRVSFDAEELPAGLYLYEIHTPDARESRPMMVMK